MRLKRTTLMFSFREEESKESLRCLAVGTILKESKIKSKTKVKTLQYLETFGIKLKTGFKDKSQCIFVNVLLRIKILNVVHELENG